MQLDFKRGEIAEGIVSCMILLPDDAENICIIVIIKYLIMECYQTEKIVIILS
jgi:hypothetical protein